jgi:hypothetical protein
MGKNHVLNCGVSLTWCNENVDFIYILKGLETGSLTGSMVFTHVKSGWAGGFGFITFATCCIHSPNIKNKAATATIVEKAVHRMGQVFAIGEVTKILGELAPVGAENGFIDGADAAFADETDRAGAHHFQGLRAAINFFYIHAWG